MGNLMMKSLKPQASQASSMLVIGVREQIVLQVLAAFPAREHFDAVRADPEHDGLMRFNLGKDIAEGTSLIIAAHGIGFGEGENDHASCRDIR